MKYSTVLLLCGATLLWVVATWAGEKTQTFTVEKGGTLVVKIDHGDIKIKPWDKNQVYVRAQNLNESEMKKIVFSQEGGTIRVELHTEERSHSSSLTIDVSVPSTFNTNLTTAGGELTLEGPLVGNQQGTTAGGDIRVGNNTGNVKMTTAGGEITVGDVNGDVTVSTAGGDVKLGKVSGMGEISTAGGEIAVESVGRDLQASTAGGDIRIGDVAGKLRATTAGGEVHVRSFRDDCTLQTAGGDIVVLAGKGNLSAATSGGEITLSKVEGSVKAKTAAGDVRVELMATGDRESSLITSAGNITLTVPPSMRATIKAQVRGAFDEDDIDSAIKSDFPVKNSEKRDHSGRVARTIELNGGGTTVTLETMIGSIEIRKTK